MSRRLIVALVAGTLTTAIAAPAGAEPLRDPFARPRAARALLEEAPAVQTPEPVLQLRAVMLHPRRALVNISGRILAVGETLDESFGNYRVVDIRERSVVLSRGSTQRVLALEPESIQK